MVYHRLQIVNFNWFLIFAFNTLIVHNMKKINVNSFFLISQPKILNACFGYPKEPPRLDAPYERSNNKTYGLENIQFKPFTP